MMKTSRASENTRLTGLLLSGVWLLVISWLPAHAKAGGRVSVKVPIANVRSGPGTGYKILWKIEKHHPLNVIRRSGKWLQFIDFEGDKGWIYRSLVSRTPTVIVRKNKCNIRSGPGLKYRVVFEAERGVSLRVVKRTKKWLKVRHADGDTGWIYRALAW